MESARTVVARKDLSTSKGIHKISWNFRYAGLMTSRASGPNMRGGPMVAPGTYAAQAYRYEGGEAKKLGDAVEFKVESIIEPTLPMQDRAEVIAMIKEIGLFANKNYAATQRLSERTEQITEL